MDNVEVEECKFKEVDIYRDTPVRLLGYANEVGEAFRAQTSPWFVRFTYGVASAYVLADTFDKSSKASKISRCTNENIIHSAIDTLLWQMFASVIIPGFTINRICKLSLLSLAKGMPKVKVGTRRWITTAIGLGSIPFIIHPIDSFVHLLMDSSIRKYLHLLPPSQKPLSEGKDT